MTNYEYNKISNVPSNMKVCTFVRWVKCKYLIKFTYINTHKQKIFMMAISFSRKWNAQVVGGI